MKFLFLVIISFSLINKIQSQSIRYGVTNNEGKYIPADINLLNDDSVSFNLKNSLNKPTVLAFVYYRCPGICNATLNGIVEVINKTSMKLGTDFDILCISIQSSETPSLAKDKKQNYKKLLNDKKKADQWKFCTTDSLSISRITQTCGFEFQKSGNEITHPATLIVVSPKGMICQYLYGTYYLPMDLELAVKTANEEKTSAPRIKKINYCYTKKYEMHKNAANFISKTGIIAFVLLIAAFATMLILKKRRK